MLISWLQTTLLIKFKFIEEQASEGNVLAKQYLEKLRKEQVSIDWAHRVLINSIREQRMLKMMAIADSRHFGYQNEDDLADFIASEMQKRRIRCEQWREPRQLSKHEVYVTAVNGGGYYLFILSNIVSSRWLVLWL